MFTTFTERLEDDADQWCGLFRQLIKQRRQQDRGADAPLVAIARNLTESDRDCAASGGEQQHDVVVCSPQMPPMPDDRDGGSDGSDGSGVVSETGEAAEVTPAPVACSDTLGAKGPSRNNRGARAADANTPRRRSSGFAMLQPFVATRVKAVCE